MKLNVKKLREEKSTTIVSSEVALKDVDRINWSKEVINDNGKDGYIKAEQLYYFNKKYIDFQVIGCMNEDSLNKLFQFIESLNDFQEIIDNLK